MRCLLMGGLSPRREVASAAWLGAGRAIADRKNIGIESGLKSRRDGKLAIGLVWPSKWLRTSGPFTPADQITSSEGMKPPSASCTPSALTSVAFDFLLIQLEALQ